MKRISGIIIFLQLACAAFSQQDVPPDSLLNQIKEHVQQDTVRLRLLTKLSEYYHYNNTDKGIAVTDEIIALAKKLNNPYYLGYAYYNREFCYYTKGDFETALKTQEQALDIFTKMGNKNLMGKAINRIGGAYIALSDYTSAINNLQKGLVLAEETSNKSAKAAVTGNMASVYYFLADYKKAIEYALISLHMNEEMGNKGQMSVMLNNVGSMYLKAKDYDNSLKYNFMGLRLNDSLGVKKGRANNFLDIGTVYSELKKYSLALDYLSKAYSLYNETGSKYNASMALTGIATIYNIAPDSFLINHGVKPSERFKKSLQFQLQALKSAKEVKNLDNLANQWKSLSDIYANNKQFDSALAAFKQYAVIIDSIAGDKKRQDITRQEMRFEAGKKEASINADHAASLKRQQYIRNGIIGGAAVLLIAGFAIFSFYKRRRDAVEKQKEAELNLQVSDTEMKALRAQMNPHFIFNSLNSISDYIVKNDTKAADEYLIKFAKLMRMILENSEQKNVTLAEDLDALELYMQLEALRLKNRFTYNIKIDDALDKDSTLVPPLILQPFVENSIWHGIAGKNGEGHITIAIKKEGTMINCIVEDNGVGRWDKNDVNDLKNSSGKRSLGMKITKERIDIINKTKKTNAVVTVTDLEQGIRVEVKLPLELNF